MTSDHKRQDHMEPKPEPNWLRYGAGVIPFGEDVKIPPGYTSCHSHYEVHKIPRNVYVICFECGHPWTKRSLRKAFRKGMFKDIFNRKTEDIFGVYTLHYRLRGFIRAFTTPAKKIYFCQECIHDF